MKNIFLKIVENCLLEDGLTGKREYVYQTNKATMKDALSEFNNNFDSKNIIESYDSFEGECLDSEVVNIEKVEVV